MIPSLQRSISLGRAAAFAAALLVAAGCGDDKSTTPNPPADEAFFPENYLSTYTMVRDCRLSLEHDSFYIQVYCDPGSAANYQNGTYPLPVGSVVVKTLYNNDDCTGLAGYAVMKKGPAGTAPQTGDWIWQDVRADRSVERQGSLASCSGCHSGCTEGRDFLCTDP